MARSDMLMQCECLRLGLLLLYVSLSAADGEMDHCIAGDGRFIKCPGCFPYTVESGSHCKPWEHATTDKDSTIATVENDSHGKPLNHTATEKGCTVDAVESGSYGEPSNHTATEKGCTVDAVESGSYGEPSNHGTVESASHGMPSNHTTTEKGCTVESGFYGEPSNHTPSWRGVELLAGQNGKVVVPDIPQGPHCRQERVLQLAAHRNGAVLQASSPSGNGAEGVVRYRASHGMDHLPLPSVLVDCMTAEYSSAADRKNTELLHHTRDGMRRPAGGSEDGLMASLLVERIEADEPARQRDHLPACVPFVFVTDAGLGADRSTPALTITTLIQETSFSYPDEQIHKQFQKSGGARFTCSLLSASGVVGGTRPEPVAAAAGKSHHIAGALPELNSDDILFSLMIMIMIMIMKAYRAYDDRKRSGRGTCSTAAVLTMMLLVTAALANSATAARPLSGSGRDEVAAAVPGKPLNNAAAGSSSCTTDPNTQEPVPCIHH